MKKPSTTKKILEVVKNGCLIFTIITVLTYVAGTLMSSENKAFIPTLKWILLFLAFSVVLAFANLLLKSKKYSKGLCLLFHFVASAVLYFVVVVLCGGFISNGSQTLIAMALFLLIYAVFAMIFALTGNKKKIKKNKEENYSSMFK